MFLLNTFFIQPILLPILVHPAGIEPASPPSEGDILSIELRMHYVDILQCSADTSAKYP